MKEKLLKLVFDYASKNKNPDLQFIDSIVDIVSNERHLGDYLKRISLVESESDSTETISLADYCFFTKEICLHVDSLPYLYKHCDYVSDRLDEWDLYLYRYISVVQIILHELEHAYQHKLCRESKDDTIKNRLIKASLSLSMAMENEKFMDSINNGNITLDAFSAYVQDHKKRYINLYKMNPIERFAEIDSYNTLAGSVELVKNKVSSLYDLLQVTLYKRMLMGYNESYDMAGLCPSQVYLYGVRKGDTWEKFDFYDKDQNQLMRKVIASHSIGERLHNGLPITYDEQSVIEKWISSRN